MGIKTFVKDIHNATYRGSEDTWTTGAEGNKSRKAAVFEAFIPVRHVLSFTWNTVCATAKLAGAAVVGGAGFIASKQNKEKNQAFTDACYSVGNRLAESAIEDVELAVKAGIRALAVPIVVAAAGIAAAATVIGVVGAPLVKPIVDGARAVGELDEDAGKGTKAKAFAKGWAKSSWNFIRHPIRSYKEAFEVNNQVVPVNGQAPTDGTALDASLYGVAPQPGVTPDLNQSVAGQASSSNDIPQTDTVQQTDVTPIAPASNTRTADDLAVVSADSTPTDEGQQRPITPDKPIVGPHTDSVLTRRHSQTERVKQ